MKNNPQLLSIKKAHTAEFRKTQKIRMELPVNLGNPPSVETDPPKRLRPALKIPSFIPIIIMLVFQTIFAVWAIL